MGTTHIEISHVRSRSPSIGSREGDDELHENGVQVSPTNVSPQYSVVHPQSQSGSSSHPSEYVHLTYPHEANEGDIGPADSASRIPSHDRGPPHPSRSNSSVRRTASRHHHPEPRDPPRSRPREHPESPTESGDSAEDFLREGHSGMPRPQSYYGQNGYTHSSSSQGSYNFPGHHMQMVPAQPSAPHPYPHQFPPQMASPPPMGYPPSHMSYQPQPPFHHPPPSHVSSPYPTSSPYGPASVMQYGAPSYFPPQYGQPYQQPFPPYHMPQYPQQQQMMGPMPPMPYNMADAYRVHSPAMTAAHSDSSASKKEPEQPKFDEEAIIKRFEAMMKGQTEEKKQSETSREDIMREAADQVKKEAAAAMERKEAEARIRDEARKEAIKAYEEKEKLAAEMAAREQQIRKEAADAALKAAAEEAAAKADRAALEKKIADDAAAAAKSEAEKAAAEAAAAAKEEAEKAQKEAADKLKEAEEAATKAKADAEAAEKKAADAAGPERKKPVRFKDAIGRNYNFPYERCCKWRDMEGLIIQAFQHIENLADHVHDGHYDLLGPDKEIIMPQYWDQTVEPDMHITMMLWPLPEPKDDPEPVGPPLDGDGILNLDDILGGGSGGGGGRKRDKDGPRKKRTTSRGPGALGMWMLGGAPKSKPHLKGDKKPEVAAGSQHGAGDQTACIVM